MTKPETHDRGPPHVYKAIAAIAADMAKDGISKDRKNQSQGYQFRGIDDVYNALAPVLARHSLVILPQVLERQVVERQTQKGGTLFYVTLKVQYDFVSALDGSKHSIVTYGEAMDSADKATNKAMSASYKYGCMLTFCIPTEGDNDADAQTHEVTPKQNGTTHPARNTAPAAASQVFTNSEDKKAWLATAANVVAKLSSPEEIGQWKQHNAKKYEALGEKQKAWLNEQVDARLVAVQQAPLKNGSAAHA